MTNLLLDGLIMSFFIMAIIFCWHLNKRIYEIKKMGARTAPVAHSFSRSIAHITKELNSLKEVSEKGHDAEITKRDFEELINQSELMMNRLEQLIEKAEKAEKVLNKASFNSPKQELPPLPAYREEEHTRRAPHLSHKPSLPAEPKLFSKSPDLSMDRNLMSVLKGIR